MKTSRTLIGITVCCFSLLACCPPAWVVVSLTDKVSVRLPVQPESHLPAELKHFIHVTDSIGDYAILITALPPVYTASQRQRQESLEYLVRAATYGQEEQLQAPTPFHLGSYEGVELAGLVSPTNGHGLRYTANRLIIVDDTCYVFQFSCLASRNKRETAGKTFLESITLKSAAD
jgi:hypothetical protein